MTNSDTLTLFIEADNPNVIQIKTENADNGQVGSQVESGWKVPDDCHAERHPAGATGSQQNGRTKGSSDQPEGTMKGST